MNPLLPFAILGLPFLVALVELIRSPKPVYSARQTVRVGAVATAAERS